MNVYCRDMITILVCVLLFFSLLWVETELPKSDWIRAFIELFKKKN